MSFVEGINHVTFAVSDLEQSIDFYENGLGMDLRKRYAGGAYLEAGNHWICLSEDQDAIPQEHRSDYTHIAFSVSVNNIGSVKSSLVSRGAKQWKDNKSEGESFYFLDPDGHKLELHVGTLASRLEYMENSV